MEIGYKQVMLDSVSFQGKGLHTGLDINMTIHPGMPDSGIKFVRNDLSPNIEITADANLVVQTQRGTVLEKNGTKVSTVEHVLSALFALDIEDAIIEVDGPEVPILDGSAHIFVQQLLQKGLKKEVSRKQPWVIKEVIDFKDEKSGAHYVLIPSDTFEAQVITRFSTPILGEMTAGCDAQSTYVEEIAPSRTFVFISELDALADAGLIKGGDIDNALVINDVALSEEKIERLKQKLNRPHVTVSGAPILGNSNMQAQNEPARHKLLDLLGDLALVGRKIQGKIIAIKPGHGGNVSLAQFIKHQYLHQKKIGDIPVYDVNKPPLMGLEDIKRFLPHRYPFLMVDKIIEMSENHIVGIKNVTGNEEFFQGHFPGNPVLPGVLQMEALAQVGGILALNNAGSEGHWDTYFLKMDNVKFKSKVLPGDTLILKMELAQPIRRGIIQMLGTAFVGHRLVSEGELTAQIVKRDE